MPLDWVRVLIEHKVVGKTKRPRITVLAKISADWRKEGRPQYALPGEFRAAPGWMTARQRAQEEEFALLERLAAQADERQKQERTAHDS
jgi:hypothetical protein